MNNALRPELDLLCRCGRTDIGEEQAKQIKTLAEKDIDWDYLLREALTHRVMPLVYCALNSTCADLVPRSVLQQFRSSFYANAARNLFQARKLIELLHLLESHRIPAIAFKGPTLAVSIYGNLALRQFGDLDIIVRERDYERARHLFISLGFRLTLEHEWEAELTDESGRVAVDLHKRMVPREFSCPLDFKYLSRRLQPIQLLGTVVVGLSPEDTLLMLGIQLTKDRYPQLAKICDMAEFLRVYRYLDWNNTLKQAKRVGGEGMLLFGLGLTSKLLKTALPPEVADKLRLRSSIDELVDDASKRVFPNEHALGDEPVPQRCHWLLRERFRDKLYPYYVRYVHGPITPCELDRRFLPLPRRLAFLYYFFRPMRLMGKYGSLLVRQAKARVPLMLHESSATEADRK